MLILWIALIALVTPAASSPQEMNHAAMAMGFDQDRTTHHFRLYDNGGAIDVSVKDAADIKNRDAIRAHLPHIAMMFGAGDFNVPMLVHSSKDIPGTTDLAAAMAKVAYTYVETPAGGRVDIVTTDAAALAALHKFLTYQIQEHHTGDPLIVAPRR